MVNHLFVMLGWLYTIVAVWLSIYSANALILALLYWVIRFHHRTDHKSPLINPGHWPVVTLQFPIYNERLVARRLIDAAARLDYPVDCLHIQVLDDSTDDTTKLVAEGVEYWTNRGKWITVHHRINRSDYKAGALKEGLKSAAGEFVAIFDADFIPPRDWLKQAIQPFFGPECERVGIVQTRWAHLNDDYSALTLGEALGLDGHFGVDQIVRSSAGLLSSFDGTAGIWRRRCIEDAGNWRGASLAEDLDLSYRAQLCGWKVRYLPDVSAPAEIPTMMIGFKCQQFRWAKGSIQVARLLGLKVLRAPIKPWLKLEGILHITGYMVSPLMLMLLLMTLPLSLWGGDVMRRLPLGWSGIVGLGPPFFYVTSQWALYDRKQWWRWFRRMPLLAMLGIGIAVSNTRGVIEGLIGKKSAFERTPKTGVTRDNNIRPNKIDEQIKADPTSWAELFLCVYALATSILAIHQGNWVGTIFYCLYAAGFAWVGFATLLETRPPTPSGTKPGVVSTNVE